MSFLKELKEDLNQAMNELISDEEVENVAEETVTEETADEAEVNTLDMDINDVVEAASEEEAEELDMESEMDSAMLEELVDGLEDEEVVEEATEMNMDSDEPESDEVTEITKGTVIEGNISSNGSLNVYGKIKGNVSCKGKLMIAGEIVGESSAKEIFVNNAKIDGDVKSDGTIKIANGSIIIGSVYATSAVVAGAIKGDIDVHGPVIVDGTAVVKGDIKSRSVQINNGAAIEGFCSQCYADIDYKTLFDETFGK